MNITSVRTDLVRANEKTLAQMIDYYIPKISEGHILVIASKVVSLCEGSVVDPNITTKDELIIQNCQLYLNRNTSKYNTMFTITKNTLMLAAGIDESNSDGLFVLWPKDPLKTAKTVYQHFTNKFGLKKFGVVIADSTSKPDVPPYLSSTTI